MKDLISLLFISSVSAFEYYDNKANDEPAADSYYPYGGEMANDGYGRGYGPHAGGNYGQFGKPGYGGNGGFRGVNYGGYNGVLGQHGNYMGGGGNPLVSEAMYGGSQKVAGGQFNLGYGGLKSPLAPIVNSAYQGNFSPMKKFGFGGFGGVDNYAAGEINDYRYNHGMRPLDPDDLDDNGEADFLTATKHKIDNYLAKQYLMGRRKLTVSVNYANMPLEYQYLSQFHGFPNPVAGTPLGKKFGLTTKQNTYYNPKTAGAYTKTPYKPKTYMQPVQKMPPLPPGNYGQRQAYSHMPAHDQSYLPVTGQNEVNNLANDQSPENDQNSEGNATEGNATESEATVSEATGTENTDAMSGQDIGANREPYLVQTNNMMGGQGGQQNQYPMGGQAGQNNQYAAAQSGVGLNHQNIMGVLSGLGQMAQSSNSLGGQLGWAQMNQNPMGSATGYGQVNPYSMGGQTGYGQMFQNSMGGQTGYDQMFQNSMGGQTGMGHMYQNSMGGHTGMGQMYPGQTGMGQMYQNSVGGQTGYAQMNPYSMGGQTGMGQMHQNSMGGQLGMGQNYQAGEMQQYGSQNSPIMMASASAEVASNPKIPNRPDSTPTDYKKK